MAYATMTTRSAGYVVPASEYNQFIANDEACAVASFAAAGDLFYGTGSKTGTKLAKGAALQKIRMNAGATAPEWASGGWLPDNPPASPGSIDDEFNDASLAGAWTEYDPDGKTTWTEGDGGAKAVTATTATLTMNGIYQTIPADANFTAYAKIGISALEVTTTYIGINLWENPAGDNRQFNWLFFRDNTAGVVGRLVAQTWTNRSTVAAAKIAAATFGYFDAIYLRLRRTGANYYCDFSTSGYGWRSGNGGAAIALDNGGVWTPTKIGIGVLNNNTGVPQTTLCQFFRYVASDVTLAGIMAGNK